MVASATRRPQFPEMRRIESSALTPATKPAWPAQPRRVLRTASAPTRGPLSRFPCPSAEDTMSLPSGGRPVRLRTKLAKDARQGPGLPVMLPEPIHRAASAMTSPARPPSSDAIRVASGWRPCANAVTGPQKINSKAHQKVTTHKSTSPEDNRASSPPMARITSPMDGLKS